MALLLFGPALFLISLEINVPPILGLGQLLEGFSYYGIKLYAL